MCQTASYIASNTKPRGSSARKWRYSTPSSPGAVLEALASLAAISSLIGGPFSWREVSSSGDDQWQPSKCARAAARSDWLGSWRS